MIEGVRGANFKGDIAIDDLLLSNGGCKPVADDACDFEDPLLCGWTQVKTNLLFM